MNTSALAHNDSTFNDSKFVDIELRRSQTRKKRRTVATTAHLAWNHVALRSDAASSKGLGTLQRPPAYVWLVVAAAVLFHAGFGWYLKTHSATQNIKPKPAEVALQFERPTPPKIEPPKPQPPKPQLKQPPQVLPPIQTAVSPPVDAPAAPSPEPPVAVAPIVTAPPPPPAEPINSSVSKAEYLNNPRGDYPAMAARQGWQGVVTVLVHISTQGKVMSVAIKKSSGRKILDDDALNVIKTWAFTPRKRGDTPVEADVTVPYEYVLE